MHSEVLQLSFDGKVIGTTTDAAVPPSPTSAFQCQTFTVPNVSPGKDVLTGQCSSAPYSQSSEISFVPIYSANVIAGTGSFGIHLGDTVTVNGIIVVETRPGEVRLGVAAPKSVTVRRKKVWMQK